MRTARICGLLLAFAFCPLVYAQSGSAGTQSRWQPPPPPGTWNAQEHHGYMDGIDAAWLDLADKLAPNPARHMQYKHPPSVPVSRQGLYRTGFRKGYEVIYAHERKAKRAEERHPR